ncbi:MAG: hypothetical protein CMM40_12435 [Rhodospirillaceae bacterium]|nr:hypothetical protein [Rhodospirillaceae bacterium]MBB59467.1 hypothetical protein [Rhodospirillaceae bacterium]
MNNPKQNRGRHRNNARRSNPSRQNFDSNGPGVRIRGNATQVYEKYIQLARDSQGSGDRVLAETMLQHAEHYYRILNENNTGERPRQSHDESASDQQNSFDDTNYEDDGDDSNDADGNTGGYNGGNNGNRNHNANSGQSGGNQGNNSQGNGGQGGGNQSNNGQGNNGQGNGGGRNNPRNNPGRGRGRRPQQNTAEGSETPASNSAEAQATNKPASNDVDPAPKEPASTPAAAPAANTDEAPKAPRGRPRRTPRKSASTDEAVAVEAPAQQEMTIIAD